MSKREFHVTEQGTVWEREQAGMWRMMYAAAQAGEGFFPLPHGHIAFDDGALTAREAAAEVQKHIDHEMRRILDTRQRIQQEQEHNQPYWRGILRCCWQTVNEKRRERDALLAIANDSEPQRVKP